MDYSYEEIISYVELYFTTGVRWVCMGLAALILLHQIFALIRMRNPSEIWAFLKCPDGSTVPLTHWENLVGRHRGCDIILNLGAVSRSHGTLIRDDQGTWVYNDLNSKNGSFINGVKVTEPTEMKGGDILTIGGTDFELYPLSYRERMENIEKRKRNTKRTSPWFSMLAITVFQLLTVIQFKVSLGEDFPAQLPAAFALLCAIMWIYVIALRMMKRTGFEVELIAFFLCTLSLAVTASAYPYAVLKQSLCVVIGVFLFFGMCWLLRDLTKAKKLVYIFMGISVLLLLFNITMGTVAGGSRNWIEIAGFSMQPSEMVKIVFIFVGAATLDELQQRKNLIIFMAFSFFCLGCLAIMGDFGTALIFFATFLVISFLRSGDFTKLFLVLGAAALMGLMVLRFMPYVAARFEVWRHVWDDPTGAGFQQVQTMTSIASGGIPGLGAGEGNLSDVAAASTDLVFGLLAEEWGLVIAILAVLCIVTLGVFAYRSIIAGRSTYYCIAACATTSLFIFQTILNVFGSVDLLPLTGVTFPFVSSGGTSMIACWGMLAFVKAADTRQNASLAVRVNENQLKRAEKKAAKLLGRDVEFDEYDDGFAEGGYVDSEQFYGELEGGMAAAPDRAGAGPMERPVEPEPYYKARQRRPKKRKDPVIVDSDQYIEQVGLGRRPSEPPLVRPVERPVARPVERPVERPVARPVESPAEPKKAHPKAVRYTEVSDDDFFDAFDKTPKGLPLQKPARRAPEIRSDRKPPLKIKTYDQPPQAYDDQDQPVSLEDIFGDDGIFGGKR